MWLWTTVTVLLQRTAQSKELHLRHTGTGKLPHATVDWHEYVIILREGTRDTLKLVGLRRAKDL